MKKELKSGAGDALKEAIEAQRGTVITSFRGVTVAEMTALRKKLREVNAEIRVVKNTLVRRAAEGTPFGDLSENFKGPTAIAFSHGDPVALARAMMDYATPARRSLQGGFTRRQVISAQGGRCRWPKCVARVAAVPLVGGMIYPITRLAQVLADGPRAMVCVLESIRKQKPEGEAAGAPAN